ncbi:hypothetical protein DQ04_03961010 [Trypanosoma grayi]|uniref:hypothetical protein n=1 Tax=Trypanosoma grayi TaxID=71804 RepID=UPI0004F4B7C2|nr:hypothetical protein DQ04_03961010 [Trypanosoma grayi]KEG10262.1 hypothetical protein DQ04_03961010 [Trypanosoma grayi]
MAVGTVEEEAVMAVSTVTEEVVMAVGTVEEEAVMAVSTVAEEAVMTVGTVEEEPLMAATITVAAVPCMAITLSSCMFWLSLYFWLHHLSAQLFLLPESMYLLFG